MGNLEDIFYGFQGAVDAEERAQTQLGDLEKSVNQSLLPFKVVIHKLFTTTPSGVRHVLEQQGPKETLLGSIANVHSDFVSKLREIPEKTRSSASAYIVIRSESMRLDINQYCIYAVMALEYFYALLEHFGQNQSEPVEARLVSNDSHQGFIATADYICSKLPSLVSTQENKNTQLSFSHYLFALLTLSDSLADYSTTVVILVTSEPLQSSRQLLVPLINQKLVTFLQQGFDLLELRNDQLRKKFDGLKYTAKKIEQVVYDLSIRGKVSGEFKFIEE